MFHQKSNQISAYHVTLLRAINDAELETLQKKWTVQPAVIHSNPELTYQYERKKVTVLLRACQPDLTNPECDSEWSQDVLDNSTMQKVVKTLCAEGPISKEINYTTTAAYCCLAHDYYHIAPVVYSWGYSASCWDLNYRKDRSCKIVDGMCECCCFASPLNARAATSVPCNLEFEGLYNNCKRELKFGRLNFSEPNVMKIPKEIPSGKEIILPMEDLKDTSYRYDNLMEFFQIDLKNLTLQQSGVVNPIGHRYSAKDTETSKLAVHSSKNRVYCAVENWNVKDLAMGCKCFRTRETLVNCCCQRNAGTTTLRAYSMALLYKQRNWNYTALAHTLRYREEFLVNRTAILRPE
uniref:SCP domain-containing protein n=1 Tax=Bursaphelenchus xylophilus TaxID=6326 RepID=A0A1I7RQP6_BURXY